MEGGYELFIECSDLISGYPEKLPFSIEPISDKNESSNIIPFNSATVLFHALNAMIDICINEDFSDKSDPDYIPEWANTSNWNFELNIEKNAITHEEEDSDILEFMDDSFPIKRYDDPDFN
jgi:hypothetical protein